MNIAQSIIIIAILNVSIKKKIQFMFRIKQIKKIYDMQKYIINLHSN